MTTFADVQTFHRDHIGACARAGLQPMTLATFVEVHWPEFEVEYRRFELQQ